jgi:hypothetical protein
VQNLVALQCFVLPPMLQGSHRLERYTQGMYGFDKDVAKALTDTGLEGDIPTDLFLRLPEWCVYLETPGQERHGATLYGFWAHVEHDINDNRPELRFLLDTEQGLILQILHIARSIGEGVSRWPMRRKMRQSRWGWCLAKAGQNSFGHALSPSNLFYRWFCTFAVRSRKLRTEIFPIEE